MPIARHHSFGRRRRHAAQRLVRQSNQRSSSHEQVQRLTAFRNGFRAIELLKRHFPDQYTTYANWQITLPFLARITEIFLRLAHQQLIYIEEAEWGTIDLDGQLCLTATAQLSDAEAESLLLEDLSGPLLSPFPYFYGFSRDWEGLFGQDDNNILLVAVWTMVRDTAWQYVDVMSEDHSPDQCLPEFSNSALAAITGLVNLPAGTPMPALCRYLNQQTHIIDESKPPLARLGDIIRYCVHQTGNGFADYGTDVIYDDFGGAIGFDWFSSDEELADNGV